MDMVSSKYIQVILRNNHFSLLSKKKYVSNLNNNNNNIPNESYNVGFGEGRVYADLR